MKHIWVTWMDLSAPPEVTSQLPEKIHFAREDMAAAQYMEFYRLIGGPVRWDTRLEVTEDQVARILSGEGHHCYTLQSDHRTIGLCEFECDSDGQAELQHFGLVPEAQGQGLGLPFLLLAVKTMFAAGAKRIWLHTDEWGSPAAQKTYLKAGFGIRERKFMDPTPL